ncbi:MAG: universal stress protein [Planctomycetaceae bacterium]|nr:universal stress protein [Planctomycetaceae bacterium]
MSATTVQAGCKKILVAVDFSPHAEAALKQAVWLAQRTGASITLAHTLPHLLPHAEVGAPPPKMRLVTDLLNVSGEGARYQALELEMKKEAEAKLRRLVDQTASGNNVHLKILQGEPYIELIRAVRREEYDLVLAGTRGLAAWEQFLVGSTAKRLIRKCPSTVWVVKAQHAEPPKTVLAATDFSDASRRAVLEGLSIAREAGAEFHLLHVIDSLDVPSGLSERLPADSWLRQAIREEAGERLADFVAYLDADSTRIHSHLSPGMPWQGIGRLAKHLHVDLIAMGTVGRGGIKGLLLGNTAEKVLDTCDCNILTVKPADFSSPIAPAH